MPQKTTQLKNLLSSGETEFILEAHNGLSARIVEEAGFKGIWGSGLALSAQHAVRDNNELSWTQVVDQLAFMTDVTGIPILLDGDTGYGDFNNMRRLVRKLGQIGVAGVCIEEAIRVTRPGGKVIFVDYHGPKRKNPMRYVMKPILAWLEPYAMDLWREELPAFFPASVKPEQIESEFYFGDLYQKIVLTV